jgi:tetratricopeptide (TPR) repeat protein
MPDNSKHPDLAGCAGVSEALTMEKETMHRIIPAIILCLFLPGTHLVHAQGADIEWKILNQEVTELYRQGKYDRAVLVGKKALEVAEANVGSDHPNVAMSLNNLAALYKTRGDYAGAEPLYKRSLAILEKALGPDHPYVAMSLNNLAALYRATKRDKEAPELEKRARRIRAIKR